VQQPTLTLPCAGAPQLVQGKLADMYTTAAAARSLVHATARAADAHAASARRLRRDCAAAILFAAEAATRVALDGIQVLGGNGYINECARAAPLSCRFSAFV